MYKYSVADINTMQNDIYDAVMNVLRHKVAPGTDISLAVRCSHVVRDYLILAKNEKGE